MDELQKVLERLAEARIQLLSAAGLTKHFAFERDGFVSLVERSGGGFGNVGAPGLLTPSGFAALVWRGARAFFVAKGYERPASAEEVEALRAFGRDLELALQRTNPDL